MGFILDPFSFLEWLRSDSRYRGQVVHVEDIPARTARYSEPALPLPRELQGRLAHLGITRLFTHQARAIDAARAGRNFVVVTGTASGKTLCYNLPVLERALSNHSANALYLFPTKALAQDQHGKLQDFLLPPHLITGTYDGDTPAPERTLLRNRGRILLSNMDMLHTGILPRHTSWGRFFRRLEFVVVDEMHSYRGVFGSHVGCVLRRLRRICRHYGSNPVFIFCSATIGNPGELAGLLSGLDVEVIDEDGAPRGPRKFVFWNPPVISADGRRRSAHTEATEIFTSLVEQGIRNITFTKARKSAEIILRTARERLWSGDEALADRIMSYRAGYRAEDRRRIEQDMFNGRLLGVVSTNALELGVDVGGLDASVLTGYPGTISSTWQQAGRAGRSTGDAISVLIGLEDPLDQYLMNNPAYFFEKGHEQVMVNPANPYILASHLLCAAHELPVAREEADIFAPDAVDLAWSLAAEDALEFKDGRFFFVPEEYPASRVSIRSTTSRLVRILTPDGRPLGEMELGRAYSELHEGAIYLHAGDTYRVEKLDLFAGEAHVVPGGFDYYTKTAEEKNLRVLDVEEEAKLGSVQTYFGKVEVTTSIIGYRRLELQTEAMLGMEPLDLPEQVIETEGVWFTIGHKLVRRLVEDDGFELMGSIHAIEHAAIGLTPLVASCDRWDVGGISHPYHLDTGGLAAIFLHDAYPGGVGIARACFLRLKPLLADTAELLLHCPCPDGCPSCIQSPKCGSNNKPLDKAGALRLLGMILVE